MSVAVVATIAHDGVTVINETSLTFKPVGGGSLITLNFSSKEEMMKVAEEIGKYFIFRELARGEIDGDSLASDDAPGANEDAHGADQDNDSQSDANNGEDDDQFDEEEALIAAVDRVGILNDPNEDDFEDDFEATVDLTQEFF